MKKRNIAIIALLFSGISLFYSEAATLEYSIEESTECIEESETQSGDEKESSNESQNNADIESAGESCEETEFSGKEEIEKEWKTGNGITSLQIPQKFDIVMDPFEIDGKTQLYSDEYIIKNTGEMAGILKLTGVISKTGGNVRIQEDRNGIHDGKKKKIFVELKLNGEDRIVLLPEGTEYEIVLAQGAYVTLEFVGEMNENAADEWKNDDVKVSVIYDWRVEEIEEEATEEESMGIETEEESTDGNTEEETTEAEITDCETEETQSEEDITEQESSSDFETETTAEETENSEIESSGEEQIEEKESPQESDGVESENTGEIS